MKKEEKAFLHKRKWFVTSLEASRGVYKNHRDFVDKIQSIEKQLDPDFCKNNLIRKEHRTTKNTIYWLTKKGCKKIAEKLSAEKRLAFEKRCKELFNPANQTPETNSTDPKMEPSKPEAKSLEPYVPQTVENLGVFVKNGIPVVSTRRIAECFDKPHKTVLDAVRNSFSADPFFNRQNFLPVKYRDAKGEMRPEYLVTEEGFMLLVMGFTGEKAFQLKAQFIAEYKAMKARLKQIVNVPVFDPSNKLESAKQMRAVLDTLIKSEETNAQLQAKIEEDKPKVDLANAHLIKKDADSSIAKFAQTLRQDDHLENIMVAGQLVEITEQNVFKWLVENKHLTKLSYGHGYRPIGKAKDEKYICIIDKTIEPIGKNYTQALITPAGDDYFRRELKRQETERNQIMMSTSDGLKLLPAANPQPGTRRTKKRRKVK